MTDADPNQVYSIIKKSFYALERRDRRLLLCYWQKKMSISKIISTVINDDSGINDFSDLEIYDDKCFYQYIENTCKKCTNWIKENNKTFYNSYNLDAKKIKNAIKVILINYEIK